MAPTHAWRQRPLLSLQDDHFFGCPTSSTLQTQLASSYRTKVAVRAYDHPRRGCAPAIKMRGNTVIRTEHDMETLADE